MERKKKQQIVLTFSFHIANAVGAVEVGEVDQVSAFGQAKQHYQNQINIRWCSEQHY